LQLSVFGQVIVCKRYNFSHDGENLVRKLAFCLFIFSVLFLPENTLAGPAVVPPFQSSASNLIAEVNALRVANGLPAYTVSSILMSTAQAQADYMAATNSITHSGPGGIGLTQRLLNAGYPLAGDLSQGGFRAENITGGPNKTAAQAVQGWTGDAPHLNTMLSPNLTEIGAGVAKVGDTYYMVIDCALPTTGGQPQEYTLGPDEPAVGTSAPSDFIVPVVTSTPDENGLVYHEVQYGQTLWAIAIEYGVKIDEIRAFNNLGPGTEIYQGDRLLVRKDAPPSPVSVTPLPTTSLIASKSAPTTTPFPTATPRITQTATAVAEPSKNSPITGIVFGIILVALLLAGIVTWMSSRKPVE
jgi:uncharacterized protein YkwD